MHVQVQSNLMHSSSSEKLWISNPHFWTSKINYQWRDVLKVVISNGNISQGVISIYIYINCSLQFRYNNNLFQLVKYLMLTNVISPCVEYLSLNLLVRHMLRCYKF